MRVVMAILLAAGSAFDDSFQFGVKAFESQDYGESIRIFEQLIDQGVVEPAVFYNLGNAYYRSGLLGPAIANYERALHLNPRMEDAAENLSRCLNETERHLMKPRPSDWEQSLLFWHYNFSTRATYVILGALWIFFWILLGVRQFRKFPYLRRSAATVAVLISAFGTSLWVKSNPSGIGVASLERIPVHYGTNETETVHFELYEGDRVLVGDRYNGWVRVETAEGERGWAKADTLTFVGPPYESPGVRVPDRRVD